MAGGNAQIKVVPEEDSNKYSSNLYLLHLNYENLLFANKYTNILQRVLHFSGFEALPANMLGNDVVHLFGRKGYTPDPLTEATR